MKIKMKQLKKVTKKKQSFFEAILNVYPNIKTNCIAVCCIVVFLAAFMGISLLVNNIFGKYWNNSYIIAAYITLFGVLFSLLIVLLIVDCIFKPIIFIHKVQYLPLTKEEMNKLGLSLSEYFTFLRGISYYNDDFWITKYSDKTLAKICNMLSTEFTIEEINTAIEENEYAQDFFKHIYLSEELRKIIPCEYE